MSTSFISRRTAFGIAGGLSAAVALSACSGSGGGKAPTKIDGLTYVRPASLPLDEFEGVHLSKTPGIAPAYEKWPAAAKASQQGAPGTGGPLKTLGPTWGTTPPAVDNNPWAQKVEQELNVKWTAGIGADYDQVAPAVLASGDLPDLMFIEYTSNAAMLQALQQGAFADLSPYLAGDKAKEYPNIAKLPAYAWDASARFRKTWIVPNTLSRIHQADVWRTDWVKAVGHDGADPKNVEEFTQLLTDIKNKKPGKSDGYPITTLDRGIQIAREMFRAPTNWREEGGKFTHMIETDEFKQALQWAANCWKAGLFNPDAITLNWSKEREMFTAGRAFMTLHTIVGLFGSGKDGVASKIQEVEPTAAVNTFIVPGATAQGPNLVGTSSGFWGGAAINAKHQKDENKMKELLRILDYWVAPFGTKEFLLMRFGVEGRQFTFGAPGQIVPTTSQALLDEMNLNTITAPAYFYFPADPQKGREVQQIMEKRAAHYLPDPTWNLSSAVFMQKMGPLQNIVDDAIRGIITGKNPLSDWDETIKRWKSAGGDASRADFEKEFASAK